VKKFVILFIVLLYGIGAFPQQKDYTAIKFKSKLRNYTKVLPKTKEFGIDKELFVELVDILTVDIFSENKKADLSNKLWLAVSNPQKFDFVYKDYSLKTIKNWGVKIKFEDPNFEPNPYLAKWTVTEDEFIYSHWAITQILTYEGLMAYSEKAKVAQKAINELLVLEKLKFYQAKPDEYAYDYLHRNNDLLRKRGLVVLIYNYHFDYIVCKIEDKDKVIELLSRLKLEFIEP
jgi:NADH:ubiquinone oxidoreductase subunit C